MSGKSPKPFRDLSEEFRQTFHYLHQPMVLPERGDFTGSIPEPGREIIADLLSRALEMNGLPEEVTAVQLVTRRLSDQAGLDYPLMIRDERHLPEADRKRLLFAFAFMICGLARRTSIHVRLRRKGRAGTALGLGAMILYPEIQEICRPLTIEDCHGMHEMNVRFGQSATAGSHLPLVEKYFGQNGFVNLSKSRPGVKWYDIDISTDSCEEADRLVGLLKPHMPEWEARVGAKNSPCKDDGATLAGIARDVELDEEYRTLVAPLHACGPIIVCAPKVYDVSQLTRVSGDWIFDAGLTLMLKPGTRILGNPALCSRIMLVAEKVAGQVAALSGLLPRGVESSRRSIVREAFSLISHSLENALATLETRDPQVRQALVLEKLAIQAAAELAGESEQLKREGGRHKFSHFAEILTEGILKPKAQQRRQHPDMFGFKCSLKMEDEISARFAALLIELGRNLAKHHEALGIHPATLAVRRDRQGKVTIVSRTMATRSDAGNLCRQNLWCDPARSLKGLRLLFRLAQSLSDGGTPRLTITVPENFIATAVTVDGFATKAGPASADGRRGWCEIRLEQLHT